MHLAEMAWKSGMRGSDLTAVNKGFQIPQSIKKKRHVVADGLVFLGKRHQSNEREVLGN